MIIFSRTSIDQCIISDKPDQLLKHQYYSSYYDNCLMKKFDKQKVRDRLQGWQVDSGNSNIGLNTLFQKQCSKERFKDKATIQFQITNRYEEKRINTLPADNQLKLHQKYNKSTETSRKALAKYLRDQSRLSSEKQKNTSDKFQTLKPIIFSINKAKIKVKNRYNSLRIDSNVTQMFKESSQFRQYKSLQSKQLNKKGIKQELQKIVQGQQALKLNFLNQQKEKSKFTLQKKKKGNFIEPIPQNKVNFMDFVIVNLGNYKFTDRKDNIVNPNRGLSDFLNRFRNDTIQLDDQLKERRLKSKSNLLFDQTQSNLLQQRPIQISFSHKTRLQQLHKLKGYPKFIKKKQQKRQKLKIIE